MRYAVDGVQREARATREVIVSGGSINSPKLLELSGIGQAELLRSLGITPVHELRGVGENLRDHYSPRVKFAIKEKNLTFNDNARGWRLAREAVKYALFREGFLASTSVPIRMYFRTRPGAGDAGRDHLDRCPSCTRWSVASGACRSARASP